MKRIYSLMPPIAVVAVIAANDVITLSACAQCVAAPSGLVSWWRAEGNANDSVGTNNGTLVGNATYGPGKVGQGFVFDGSSSAVNVGNGASLNLQDFTCETWIQRAQSNIVTLNSGGVAHLLDGGSSGYYFAIANNGSLWVGQNWVSGFTAGPGITDTSWHHVAVTKSGTNAVLYIDGTGYPLPPFPGTFLFNTPFTIGAYVNYDYSFMGTIDEMSIYNRALTASEIQAIHNAGSSGKCLQCVPAPSGLVSWWRAESNTWDQVGVNNGTLVGNATYGPGKVGRGFVFDGNSSAVNVGNDASLNSQDVTLETWIQRAHSNIVTLNSSGVAHLLDGGSSGYYFAIANNGSVSLGQNWVSGFTAGPGITDTGWHHVAATKSGTNAVLYIDGTGYPLPPFPGTFLFNTPFTIGAYVNYDYSFMGTIDEMSIYNRALTASEIQAIYNAGSAGKCIICNPATATAEVVNGFVVGTTITHFGCGYTNTPLVAFQGGGGTGAAATAVLSNGVVEEIIITDAGNGYTNPPTIVIGFPPSIAVEPQSVIANHGDNVSFNVTLANPTAVAYQWLFNSNSIPGATSSTLVISNVVQTNLGAYSVVLTSPFGTTNSSEAILSMYPFLTGPFGGAVTYWGMAATLSVQAVGSDPLSYQWYQNGVAVPNGTNAALSFAAIQFTNAGLYSVVVINPYGSVTNAPAQVVVNPAGVSLGLYPGITITGVVGYNYTVQRTADLSNTNAWVTMTNLTLAQPVELWVDTSIDASLPANPHHFYRVLPGQ